MQAYDIKGQMKQLKDMMKDYSLDMMILLNSKSAEKLPPPEGSDMGHVLKIPANDTYYIGLRIDEGKPNIATIIKIEGTNSMVLTNKLFEFKDHTQEIIDNMMSDAMTELQVPSESFFQKGCIYFVNDSNAVKQLDMLVEEEPFNIGRIVVLGKRDNLQFSESYNTNYCIAIFQNHKKIGQIEVDKATRTTLKKEIPEKYQEIADHIEHVFKKTKNESYPIEFHDSLDRI